MHPAARDNINAMLLSLYAMVLYLGIVLATGATAALTLPFDDLFRSAYLGGRPITFTATLTVALFMLTIASLVFAHAKIGGDSPLRLEYWITYTGLTPGRLWMGELLFALLHSLLLTGLILPVCTLAAGVSGVPPRVLGASLLLLLLTLLSLRLLGLAVAALPRSSSLHAFFLLWLPALFVLLILPGFAPALHPLGALSALLPGTDLLPPGLQSASALPYVAAALALALAAALLLLALLTLRHGAARHERSRSHHRGEGRR
jgi:hypothetical protein